MNSNIRNIVLWVMVLGLVVLVYVVARNAHPQGKTPQFSELYNDVTDDKIASATLNATTGEITGKYKSGDDFHSTVPPAYTDFQKLMLDKHVAFNVEKET